METNNSHPDHSQAAADLAAAVEAERAVRDRPWPLWLYPANTVLLGLTAANPLIPEPHRYLALLLPLVAVLGLNFWAGHIIGTPFAIPSSRGFRLCVALSAAFMVAAFLVGLFGERWLVLPCAVGAALAYAIGSLIHIRSTRR